MIFCIVDDEELIHVSLKKMIDEQYTGSEYIDFYKPVQLLEFLAKNNKCGNEKQPIDLIFLDHTFLNGSKTGMDYLPKIRSKAVGVPIILFTGTVEDYDIVKKIHEFDLVSYLDKPVKPVKLYSDIEQILSMKNQKEIYENMLMEMEKRISDLRTMLEAIADEDERAEKMISLLSNEEDKNIVKYKNDIGMYKDELTAIYSRFDDKVVKFLSTAEFLYNKSKDFDIDFSPIAINYGKTVEYLMNIVLKKQGYINSSDSLMLGDICRTVYKNRLAWNEGFFKKLDAVRECRNKIAHTNGVGLKTVDKLRRILFGSKKVSDGENLLGYLESCLR